MDVEGENFAFNKITPGMRRSMYITRFYVRIVQMEMFLICRVKQYKYEI